ncbi:MAG: alcohol dehydrogenase catalytic domain-containing protein [Thalassobaculaceae bacterium]|nr:alcohol dehydrogenase catalytic domain-containing protein [Thalassobaculaceae bacterium]
MRAVAKLRPEPGAMGVIEVDRPEPGPGEVLLRIAAGGICGTDVAIWKWHEAVVGQYAPTFPIIVGHEFAGIVEQAPAGSSLTPGDVVAVNPQIGCGRCRYCGLGRPTLCDDRRLMGGHIDGGWTEFVTVPERQAYLLPKGVDPVVAPLLEPMSVAVHAVLERVPVRAGEVVAVIGAGPIGLLTGLVARHAGASEVIVTGIAADADRLRLAVELGMIAVNVEATDPLAAIRAVAPGGADVVYETSGNAAVVEQMLAMASKAGRVGLIGLCHGPATVVTTPTVLKELEIIGSRGYNDPTWRLTMRLLPVLAGDVMRLITHELALDAFETALALVARREGMKIILRP